MCALCVAVNDIGAEGAVAMGPHLGKLVNMQTLDLESTCCALCVFPQSKRLTAVFAPPPCSDCNIGAAGWRSILQSLAHVSSIKTLTGLKYDFTQAMEFDPADVLRDLRWPVDLLQHPDPESAILQFCREMSHGTHHGDPVASVLLLGPGGAGKSTLLHRLQTGKWNPDVTSTDGLRVGTSRVCKLSGIGL